jgi:hypothetical protein
MIESLHLPNSLRIALASAFLVQAADASSEAIFYQRWDRAYGGLDSETLLAAKLTADGGYILVGRSTSTGSRLVPGGNRTAPRFGDADAWVVRADDRGVPLWDYCAGGTRADSAVAVVPTDDGGFVVAGSTASPADGNKTTGTFGQNDYWVFKLNGQGQRVWEAGFGSTLNDTLTCLVPLTGGGFLLGGTSDSPIGGNKSSAPLGGRDFWIIKIDAQGQKVWEQVFGGTSDNDLPFSAIPTTDGGALLCGVSDSLPGPGKTSTSQRSNDPWVVRIDSSGFRIWDHNYAKSDDSNIHPPSMQVVAAGADRFLLSVGALAPVGNAGVIRVFELDSAGTLIARRDLDPQLGNNVPLSLEMLTEPGGGLVVGYPSALPPADRYRIRQFGADGSGIGTRIIAADPRLSGILPVGGLVQTEDGDFVLAGSTQEARTIGDRTAPLLGAIDFWLVKFGRRVAPAGTPQVLVNGQLNLDTPLTVASGSALTFTTSFPSGSVFYTTDGTKPDSTAHPGSEPLLVTTPLTVRALAYSSDHSQTADMGSISVQVVAARHLTKSVTGQGTIYTDLSEPYPNGALVFVKAVPQTGSRFKLWGGDLAGQPQVTTLLMDRDRTISAAFDSSVVRSFLVTTLGGGTVGGGGGLGLKEYPDKTSVSLTAQPEAGWKFLRWKGDAGGPQNPINVLMDRDKSVEAVFGTSFSTATTGPGVVLPSQFGRDVPFGSTVRFSAVPRPGSYFVKWENAATGNANPFDLVVNTPAPKVSALFAPLTAGKAALGVVTVGDGKVFPYPEGSVFPVGSAVTLTAVPDPGQKFLGWAGDATGAVNPLTLKLGFSKLVYARFTPLPALSLVECVGVDCGTGAKLALNSVTPGRYVFETATAFSGWLPIGTVTNETGHVEFVHANPAAGATRFYRARFAPLQ